MNNIQGGNSGKNRILKIARVILIGVLVIAGLFVFFNYLIFWFLPFILAWIISLMIQPAVMFLHSKLKLPRKLATVIFLLFLFAVPGFITFLIVDRIIFELTFLSENFDIADVTNKISGMIDDFFAWLEKTFETIPFFSDNNIIEQLRIHLNAEIGNMLTRLVSVDQIQTFITSIITTIPKILVYTIITIVSTFYIALDFKNINRSVALQIPPKVRNVMIDIKSRFLEAIYKYIRAYFTIFIIVYSQLTVGFLIIGIRYAFLIALLVALIDIIPVLGTGTILIPWGIISIIQKDYFTGFALLILYAVIMVIRNIIEPKIVGASIGLYPVVTLIAMFVGFNIIGIPGLFLFPITILILKNLNDEGKINIWKIAKKDIAEKEKEKLKTKKRNDG